MVSPSPSRWTGVFLCFLVSLGTASGYYNSYSSDYSSSASTNSRLAKLEKKMDILINEVSRLADSNTDGADSEAPHFEIVTLISAERTPGQNGSVDYSLIFTKNVEQLYYIVSSGSNKIAQSSNIQTSDGRSSLTFTCDNECEKEDTVDVLFTNSSKSFEVTIELNTGSQASYQEKFTVPSLEIRHSGDLVYDAGRNISFEMSTSYGSDRGFSHVSLSLDPGTGRVGRARPPRGLVRQGQQTQYLNTEESVVTIATYIFNISGFFHASLTYTDPDTVLVKKIKVERTLTVRPRDQAGPYDADYVTFRESNNRYETSQSHRYCQIDHNCTLSCNAIGMITDLQVLRQKVEGEQWEPVEPSELVFDFSRSVEWTIHPNASWDDMRFRCLVHSETSNATHVTFVQYYSPEFYIDANRSSIHVETNETHPDMHRVTVNCRIVGRPVTYTYIDLRFEAHDRVFYHHSGAAQQVPVGDGETIATLTTELEPSWYPLEYFSGARCSSGSSHERYREVELNLDWTQAQSEE